MTTQQLLTSEQYTAILEHGLDKMRDGVGVDQHASDLHNELYNMDYFIIGTYQAKQFLGEEAFEAIEIIKNYEQDNFGEVTTDLSSPESVANMLAYIVGEEILSESDTLSDKCDSLLSEDDIKNIIEELSDDS